MKSNFKGLSVAKNCFRTESAPLRKSSRLQKMWTYWSLRKTGADYKEKFVSAGNRLQIFFGKIKKSSKVGQDQ